MRPKLFTPRFFILALLVVGFLTGLVIWQLGGGKLPFIGSVPSTAGKIAWVRDGDLFMADGATGANAVSLTPDKQGDDDEPAWSPNGETIALTSDRNGVSRQVYVMNAVPGAKVGVLTNSSTSKVAPRYATTDDLYFLDGGRIAKITPKTADVDAVFPTAELKRTASDDDAQHSAATGDSRRSALTELLSTGGVARFAVSEDGSRVFSAITRERGEALMLYTTSGEVVAFGVAEKILFRYLPNGDVIALFIGGESFVKPSPLMLKDTNNVPQYTYESLPEIGSSDENRLVRIKADLSIETITPVPFAPTGLDVSPDGSHVAITAADKDGKGGGVFVFSPGDGQGGQVAALSATEPVFSPDGSQIAFVSGDDVFTVAATPGGEPVNLTKGVGTNTAPAWSPAKKTK